MPVTDPVMLPGDVVITPVAELAHEVRRQFECEDGDFAISRPAARTGSKIVDPSTASLLEQFRSPTKLVDGIIAYSHTRELDPEQVLVAAFPLLLRLYNDAFLVPEGSAEAEAVVAKLAPDARIGDLVITRQLQVLEDTEVHEAMTTDRRRVAIKIARHARSKSTVRALAHEARVLARLEGRNAPRLVAEGEHGGRRYLAMEFCTGVTAQAAAEQCRERRDGAAAAVLRLCRRIAHVYAELHTAGVVHGDVHPRNMLVDGDVVRLIDFGMSRLEPSIAGFSEPSRGGIGFFFEPELASAPQGQRPRATLRGEQYALGALCYNLVAGAHYLDFALERERMFRQIAHDPPLPFAAHGLEPWPELEAILRRALSKDPDDRYADVAELAAALDAIAASAEDREIRKRPSSMVAPGGGAAGFLDDMLHRLSRDEGILEGGEIAPPRCSVNYGAGGIAYMFYRVACLRDDPRLLNEADLWITRALRDADREDAFYSAAIDITQDVVGDVSLFHSRTGLHLVHALVAQAMGDFGSLEPALMAFVAEAARPCANADLTLGRASLVLGCALLAEMVPSPHPFVNPVPVIELGNRLLTTLWKELDASGPIAAHTQLPLLGIAHGWAGFLFATLRFCQAARVQLPTGVAARLDELERLAVSWGRGLRWPRKVRQHGSVRPGDFTPGWCNGTAGMVPLWLLASAMTGETRLAHIAERAALDAWDSRDTFPTLCCGSAGRAYAMLSMHRASGDRIWLERASELAEDAAARSPTSDAPAYSLYKGSGGVALLAADLAFPAASALPLFEPEGWSRA